MSRRGFLLASTAAATAAGGALAFRPTLKTAIHRLWKRIRPAEVTPYVVHPMPADAPTLHFIGGMEVNKGDLRELAQMTDWRYRAHIPGIRILYYRCTDDVHDLIRKAAPTGPICLLGFSYGGGKAVEVCRQFNDEGRTVDHLVLLDPVRCSDGGACKPNNVDFVLPPNVVEAVCYYCVTNSAPYSAPIRGTSVTRYENILLGTWHGAQVWRDEPLDKLALALSGRPMVPVAAPPTPAVLSSTVIRGD